MKIGRHLIPVIFLVVMIVSAFTFIDGPSAHKEVVSARGAFFQGPGVNAETPSSPALSAKAGQPKIIAPANPAGEDNSKEIDRRLLMIGRRLAVPPMEGSDWQTVTAPDGRRSRRIAIRSANAVFLRPHFKTFEKGTKALVYGEYDSSPQLVRDMRAQNGMDGFWGPVVSGETLYVEILDDADSPPHLEIDLISHGFIDPLALAKEQNCHLDPNCYAEWTQMATAIAMIQFETFGGTALCTGSLIADAPETGRLWFYTANHCVGGTGEADSLIAYWNYAPDTCNGTVPQLGSVEKSYGADLIVTEGGSFSNFDFTLLMLREPPPDGTAYLGWTTDPLASNEAVAVVHHPDGAWRRLSFGNMVSSSEKFWVVNYTEGRTEKGSSGSPLFNSDQKMVGSLTSGFSYCWNDMNDQYARFDKSWDRGLSDYLSTSPTTTTTIPPDDDAGGDDWHDDTQADDDATDDSTGDDSIAVDDAADDDDDGGACGC
jgi:hypothetical protein